MLSRTHSSSSRPVQDDIRNNTQFDDYDCSCGLYDGPEPTLAVEGPTPTSSSSSAPEQTTTSPGPASSSVLQQALNPIQELVKTIPLF